MFFISVKKENFINREFSFTLHEDIYLRYQSFNTLQEFESEVQHKCPFKIDIGAVFNMRSVFISVILTHNLFFILYNMYCFSVFIVLKFVEIILNFML